MEPISASYIRSFVFGVEDSLVSTVGLVSGVAISGMTRPSIILTGAVLVFVEAFSMAVGSLLSDNSVREYEYRKTVPMRKSIGTALIMFFSYFLAGVLVLLPYFVMDGNRAVAVSIGISLLCLFLLGAVSARLTSVNNWFRKGVVMVLIGGAATLIGVLVGRVFSL